MHARWIVFPIRALNRVSPVFGGPHSRESVPKTINSWSLKREQHDAIPSGFSFHFDKCEQGQQSGTLPSRLGPELRSNRNSAELTVCHSDETFLSIEPLTVTDREFCAGTGTQRN